MRKGFLLRSALPIALGVWLALAVFVNGQTLSVGCPAPVPATVVRVIDADTLEVDAKPWPDLTVRARIRVLHLWAPERYTPEGKRASAAARALLPIGSALSLRPTGARSMDRTVSQVCRGSEDFAARMVADGHGTAAK